MEIPDVQAGLKVNLQNHKDVNHFVLSRWLHRLFDNLFQEVNICRQGNEKYVSDIFLIENEITDWLLGEGWLKGYVGSKLKVNPVFCYLK